MPNANILNASTLLPCNSFSNKNSALLSSSSPNAYTNFMYANWIDLHTKMPDQTKYLFCLQGNLSLFHSFKPTHINRSVSSNALIRTKNDKMFRCFFLFKQQFIQVSQIENDQKKEM